MTLLELQNEVEGGGGDCRRFLRICKYNINFKTKYTTYVHIAFLHLGVCIHAAQFFNQQRKKSFIKSKILKILRQ